MNTADTFIAESKEIKYQVHFIKGKISQGMQLCIFFLILSVLTEFTQNVKGPIQRYLPFVVYHNTNHLIILVLDS